MRVARATLTRRSIPLRRAVGNARAAFPERRQLLLQLWDQAGRRGLGEASPLPGYSPAADFADPGDPGDALDRCEAELAHIPWGDLPSANDLPALRRLCLGLPLTSPAARCAAETALLDLLAQQHQISLATLLAEGRRPWQVALSGLLPQGEPAAILTAALRLRERGAVSAFKLKVGRDFAAEIATLRLLRQHLGPEFEIRLDANQSWSREEAAAHLRALAAQRPSFVEEPTAPPGWPVDSPVPLAVDESLQSDAGQDLLLEGRAQVAVLKPMALGGPLRCLDIARLAAQCGAALVVTHLFDGRIALGMARALAAALPLRPLPCGLDDDYLDDGLDVDAPLGSDA